MKKLTKEEALAQGYTHCNPWNCDIKLIPIEEYDFMEPAVLIEIEPTPYTLTAETIADIIGDFVGSQEDDGKLVDIALMVDYTKITETLNQAFSKMKYYHNTDIMLTK